MKNFSSLLFFLFWGAALSYAQNLQKIGYLSYGSVRLAGCWHYVDKNGTEWGLIGTSVGLSVVDLSDPTQPVERFTVPGLVNNWREVRTWAGYAYVCSEAVPSGITIINLNYLPDSIPSKVWRGDGLFVDRIKESHTLQTRDGYLYTFGGNDLTDGAIIISLDDPWNPHITSRYPAHYVHDGYIRNDTLWTSEGNASRFGVIDVTDKENPVLLLNHPTPGGYAHNLELSKDGKTLFTTDEVLNAPLAAFDVSDLNDIKLLDLYRPSKKPNGEVHNVRVMDDRYLVCPSYRGQLTIVDASEPDNLIETAWDSLGTQLIWDADPYLPSGILLATAANGGLFVYQPTYQRAARLQGTVKDAFTQVPLPDAKVFILNTLNADTTRANGVYKTGAAAAGNYAVKVERAGYQTQVVTNVTLTTGAIVTRDFDLIPEANSAKDLDSGPKMRATPTLFNESFQVEMSAGSTLFRLCDMSGKIWLEQKAAPGGITRFESLSSLPAGVYRLLALDTESGRQNAILVAKR